MPTNDELTGTLRGASPMATNPLRLIGRIYGDARGQWPDGIVIVTSEAAGMDGDVLTTVSGSRYMVEWESEHHETVQWFLAAVRTKRDTAYTDAADRT